MQWWGTPSLVARVAERAHQLVAADDAPSELRIKADAAAWESEFITVDDFLGRLNAEDLPDLEQVEVAAEAQARKILISFAKPAQRPFAAGSSSRLSRWFDYT
jgi:hypothetical protein